MTVVDLSLESHIRDKTLVLATDLDGTFLGGTVADRRRLYDWIEARRNTVGLVFVTGRDPEFIVDLTERQGVPRPDYVIGDVGTTIARVGEGGRIDPIRLLEEDIAELWADSGEAVRSALRGAPGLTEQPTPFRYRVSYDLDSEAFDPATVETVEALGLDMLISDGRFLDVLPRGVSKGPSLLRLLDHLGVGHDRCLAAGDTLNDLSMLMVGVPAVAVGGAEPALVERVQGLAHVHLADAIGAAGISEAIRRFEMHPEI